MRSGLKYLGLVALVLLAGFWALTLYLAGQNDTAAEGDYPPTGEIIQVDGYDVHYVTQGAGPNLILLHGAGANLNDFLLGLMAAAAENFRVTAFDRPGLGYTDSFIAAGETPQQQAMFLAKAADQLGLKGPIILGHSFGGAVALAWAQHAPGSVKGLAIVGGATMPWEGGLDAYYPLAAHPISGFFIVPLLAAFVDSAAIDGTIAQIFAPDLVPAGYSDKIGAGLSLRQKSIRANTRQVVKLHGSLAEMSATYADIDIPVELLHGTDDQVAGLAVHSEPLSKILPNAQLTPLDGIGHMPQHSARRDILDALERVAKKAGLL